MASSVKALINPVMLTWAREKSNLTIEAAALSAGVNSAKLYSWEADEKQPTFKQLIKLANIYKRPIPLFYLSNPPIDYKPLEDYRKLYGITQFTRSAHLSYEIRKAYNRRSIALELFELLNEEVVSLEFPISMQDNHEDVAIKIRQLLNISLNQQVHWNSEYNALNAWREAIERKGVLVFQAERIELSEMRGFAIAEQPLPIVVVNKRDVPQGRIFSMLHEFVHILLGQSSISGNEIFEKNNQSEIEKIEVFCNSVAASVLLPLSFFHDDVELRKYASNNNWTDDTVKLIAKRFSVSREFIWRRLLTSNKINLKLYQQKRAELQEEYDNYKEKPSGRPPYHLKLLSSIGNLYPRLVLESYYRHKITASSLSEYLGMKLKHLHKVESSVSGYSS